MKSDFSNWAHAVGMSDADIAAYAARYAVRLNRINDSFVRPDGSCGLLYTAPVENGKIDPGFVNAGSYELTKMIEAAATVIDYVAFGDETVTAEELGLFMQKILNDPDTIRDTLRGAQCWVELVRRAHEEDR